ncbi:hypothetical protein CHL_1006 [Campylobacter hyointestinalis subsp. lawsonii CCUG 27631]|uniref:hypothetical protein n=1 Tax=Campylobacter hyointestinalis TaxID=198 RepID=UPI0007C947AD|nr:hypothetical protein [Campylobacter hyointestinalis]ANE34353.1 hypothetical protein CHL_1006 [Campylobacter hyointestinalis subsp. lawsonii CCUG 27631]
MTSIHDLKLGSNTLEVLEVILKSLEAFPDEIAKLDLSKFTKIASDIDILAQNVIQVQNNISDMKTAIQNSKSEFDTNKANFDTKYRQFGQDLVTAEAIKQTILDTQNAINMVKNEVDEAKTYLDTFNAKYDKFSKEYKTIMEISANIDSIENLINDLRDVLDNGVIDDNNVSAQKTYSSKKISDDAQALKMEFNNRADELSNRADELSQSLNQGLETKLSKAEYEADKPTFALKADFDTKLSEMNTNVTSSITTMNETVANKIKEIDTTITTNLATINETAGNKLKDFNKDEFHLKNSANGSKVTSVSENTVDLSQGDNFIVSLPSSGMLTLTNPSVGQSGVLIVSNTHFITGYSSNIQFRVTPISLISTETFAYFVQSEGVIIMGRV